MKEEWEQLLDKFFKYLNPLLTGGGKEKEQ
jgi:hypothetical protein